MRELTAIVALLAAPAGAAADAHETSLDVGASVGVARVTDARAPGDARDASAIGGRARFTWATLDWLQWDVTGFALRAAEMAHRGVVVDDSEVDFARGATVIGVEPGATLRLGAQFIPTVGVGLGPQLHLFPTASAGTGDIGASLQIDVGVRISAGFDWRVSNRVIVGARAAARASLAVEGSRWTSLDATVHLSYAWYPRWWRF